MAAKSLLALDLGTTTGWAYHSSDAMIDSGSTHLNPTKNPNYGSRYLGLYTWLDGWVVNNATHHVCFENVQFHSGWQAAHVYGGLKAILTMFCEKNGIPYSGVPVGTIKRFATGKGNAKKFEVIDAMRARGHLPADDNEADALALLYYAMHADACAGGK